jgi:hypothetical protein
VYYYVLPKIGDGTQDDPIRPDIPEGISFVNHPCDDGTCLTATAVQIPNLTPMSLEGLEYECEMRGLSFDEVLTWFVG